MVSSGLGPASVLGPNKTVKADPTPRPINRNVTAELKSYSLFIISASIVWLQSVRFEGTKIRVTVKLRTPACGALVVREGGVSRLPGEKIQFYAAA